MQARFYSRARTRATATVAPGRGEGQGAGGNNLPCPETVHAHSCTRWRGPSHLPPTLAGGAELLPFAPRSRRPSPPLRALRSGQAWALYGFTVAYEATREPLFRKTAQRAADLFLKRLTPDGVPLWDFDAPPSQVGVHPGGGQAALLMQLMHTGAAWREATCAPACSSRVVSAAACMAVPFAQLLRQHPAPAGGCHTAMPLTGCLWPAPSPL